jgi:preprotein translocase subunit SecG
MRWRKMTWALIMWSVLMLVLTVSATNSADCGSKGDKYSQAGCEAGAGIGVGIMLVLWFIGFIVLSLIWFMTRPRERSTAQPPAVPAPSAPPPSGPAAGWYPDPYEPGSIRYWDGYQWGEEKRDAASV